MIPLQPLCAQDTYIEVESESLTDIDGNVYRTVKIGNQVWMAENLRVTRYRDGTKILLATSHEDWKSDRYKSAYCFYNDDATNGALYGALYNWFALTDARKIAPKGWHVPTDDEWKELERTLGMGEDEVNRTGGQRYRGSNEGSKLAGNADLWENGALKNDIGFGSSGFLLLPSGYRSGKSGTYSGMGKHAEYFSVTEYNNHSAWDRKMDWRVSGIGLSRNGKYHFFPVRLVRD